MAHHGGFPRRSLQRVPTHTHQVCWQPPGELPTVGGSPRAFAFQDGLRLVPPPETSTAIFIIPAAPAALRQSHQGGSILAVGFQDLNGLVGILGSHGQKIIPTPMLKVLNISRSECCPLASTSNSTLLFLIQRSSWLSGCSKSRCNGNALDGNFLSSLNSQEQIWWGQQGFCPVLVHAVKGLFSTSGLFSRSKTSTRENPAEVYIRKVVADIILPNGGELSQDPVSCPHCQR